jgi:hypothetical protein
VASSKLQRQTKVTTVSIPSSERIVGEKLYLPSVGQRDHVVNVDVAGSSPGGAIVRGFPGARCGGACRICHDARAVTLENRLTRVACSVGYGLVITELWERDGKRKWKRTRSG